MVLGKKDRMISSYSIQCHAWKRTKSFFPVLDITVGNNFSLLAACGTRVTLSVTSLVYILMWRTGSLTLPTLNRGQIVCFSETIYIAWSKLKWLLAISIHLTVLSSLLWTRTEEKGLSARSVMWTGALGSVLKSTIQNWNCFVSAGDGMSSELHTSHHIGM